MRTIRISEEVWNEIANRGIFGETPDIVLRRVFGVDKTSDDEQKIKRNVSMKNRRKAIYATDPLTARVEGNTAIMSFASGVSRKFPLPDRLNREEIRNVTTDVMNFVEKHGGTEGQINAGRKALTDAGYHIVK